VLSDPQKRQRYDAFGHAADGVPPDFGPFSFDSAFDLFEMFFGGGTRRRARSGPRRGDDLRMNIEVTFEESVFGAARTIEVPRAGTCAECKGSGSRPGTEAVQCEVCHGAGQVRRSMQSIFGQMATVSACPHCHGEGRVVTDPCPKCGGQGRVEERRTVEVTIPAGVDDDVTLRLTGEGGPGRQHHGADSGRHAHRRRARRHPARPADQAARTRCAPRAQRTAR